MTNIMCFGDWHGNTSYAIKSLKDSIEKYPDSYLVHQGDFGFTDTRIYTQKTNSLGDIELRGYVYEINKYLDSIDKNIYVVLGNHENYTAIDEVFKYHGLYNNIINTKDNKHRVILKEEHLCLNEELDDDTRQHITMYRYLYDALKRQQCFMNQYIDFYNIIDSLVDMQEENYEEERNIIERIIRNNDYELFYNTLCQEGYENDRIRKISPLFNLLTQDEKEFFDTLLYYEGCIDIDSSVQEIGQLLYITGDEKISTDYYDDQGFIISPLFPRIKIIPRGHVWTWGNTTIASFGGALSINKKHLERMKTWCEEERPTYEQAYRLTKILPEKVDVLLTHDIPYLASCMIYNQKDQKSLARSWGEDIVKENTEVTKIIETVSVLCNPDRIVSGHHHKRKDLQLYSGALLHILDCDRSSINDNHINFDQESRIKGVDIQYSESSESKENRRIIEEHSNLLKQKLISRMRK